MSDFPLWNPTGYLVHNTSEWSCQAPKMTKNPPKKNTKIKH